MRSLRNFFSIVACGICTFRLCSLSYARDDWENHMGASKPQGNDLASTCLTLVASAVGGISVRKFILSPLRNSRRKKSLNKMIKKAIRDIEKDPTIINIQLSISENQRILDSTLEVAREWEKRLYSLPDRNNDGKISRLEFDDYMTKYRKMHPHLRDVDLPKWTDMDTDRTGYITFQEWLEYMDRVRNQRAIESMYGY